MNEDFKMSHIDNKLIFLVYKELLFTCQLFSSYNYGHTLFRQILATDDVYSITRKALHVHEG